MFNGGSVFVGSIFEVKIFTTSWMAKFVPACSWMNGRFVDFLCGYFDYFL